MPRGRNYFRGRGYSTPEFPSFGRAAREANEIVSGIQANTLNQMALQNLPADRERALRLEQMGLIQKLMPEIQNADDWRGFLDLFGSMYGDQYIQGFPMNPTDEQAVEWAGIIRSGVDQNMKRNFAKEKFEQDKELIRLRGEEERKTIGFGADVEGEGGGDYVGTTLYGPGGKVVEKTRSKAEEDFYLGKGYSREKPGETDKPTEHPTAAEQRQFTQDMKLTDMADKIQRSAGDRELNEALVAEYNKRHPTHKYVWDPGSKLWPGGKWKRVPKEAATGDTVIRRKPGESIQEFMKRRTGGL